MDDYGEEPPEFDGSFEDESSDRASLMSGEDAVSVHDEDQESTKPLDPKALEERKKQKRIEKLEKRIKALQKKAEKTTNGKPKREKFEREASEIKNKHKRQEVVIKRRMAAN